MESFWYAFQIQPGREDRALYGLEMIFGKKTVYLPRCGGAVVESERYGRMSISSTMIPGYLFAELPEPITIRQIEITRDAPYVVTIMPNRTKPARVSEALISAMRKACDKLIFRGDDSHDLDWMRGNSFWISGGAFRDHVGLCVDFEENHIERNGVKVVTTTIFMGMQILGHLDLIKIDLTEIDLEPVGKKAGDSNEAYQFLRNRRMSKKRKPMVETI